MSDLLSSYVALGSFLPRFDEDEGVPLGDGLDTALHLVLSHLNKLAVFFFLVQRVEPVHCHPVELLDLRQAFQRQDSGG